MDIVTYAAANGISVEDAIAVLTQMGSTPTLEAQKPVHGVFQVNPRDYIPRDPDRTDHYAGAGAAQSWRRLPHLR